MPVLAAGFSCPNHRLPATTGRLVVSLVIGQKLGNAQPAVGLPSSAAAAGGVVSP